MKAFSRLPVWFRMPLASVLVLIALAVTVHFPLFGRIPWMLSMLAIGLACAIGETGAALFMAGIAAFGVNRLVLIHSITIARPTPMAQTIAFLVVASFLIYLVHLRNRALRIAEASESHYRSLTEAASDVVISIDSESRILSINPAVKTMFGFEPEELLGGQMTQLMPERLRSLHKSGLAHHLRTGERHIPWNGIMLTGRHKDGREIPLEVSFGSYRQNGKTFFTGFIRDISERHRIHSALMENEKLAAVGRLASSIAHEINNPLEAVTNLLYLAQRSHSQADANQFLQTADLQLRRVSVIANQTLQFHKSLSEPHGVLPAQLIVESHALFQGRLVNLRVAVLQRHRATRAALCVEGEICQVLHNLIGNALDALGSKGGRLLLRTRDATDWKTGAAGIVITVADTAPGMSSETTAKIFEAFFSTKGKAGVGLGLWITSQLVENNAGRLRVRSSQAEEHHGTVFNLFLPAATAGHTHTT